MSDTENIYKNIARFFFGYLCAVAILGTFAPGYLFESLNLRPIESHFGLLFHSFLYGMFIFAMWQLGYYVSELTIFIYRKLGSKEVK